MPPKGRKRRSYDLIPTGGPVRHLIDTAMIVVGSLITALAFNMFLLPSHIASGGVSGLSVVVNSLFGIEPAYVQWALNIPLFFAGWFLLGRNYAARSLLGTILMPLFVYLTDGLAAPTHDPLLSSLYGGIGVGLGLGIVFRGRGSTGGFSTLAQIIQKFSGLSLATCVVMLDGTVITVAGFVLSPEKALYALIGLYITGKIIDAVELGFNYTKVAYIIAEKTEEISEAVLNHLDRGLTKLNARGGYTGDDRTVLMVVVGQSEVTRLKTLVQQLEPTAFVIISNAHEVLGEGFKRQEE
ncbi:MULTISPECIES: YitT family protein [Paenibacillus]|uniref:YitT family protein n=1 Tax=Paenibacillus TaxID=44249 RepID=UPI000A971B87|nr:MULTISPECIES: YitT family protein [Paenibacillus]GIP21739.1 membrane protein [Paenibacillus sp. J22TS3]